ncbi:MAG: transcriptional repressor [Anaerolineaceae bacterium]|nr:transcriptional repressor [Anaerolineaceae bacterium]
MVWQKYLTKAGYKITAPREHVMEIISSSVTPMSPQEIHLRASRAQQKLGLVSVYRVLDLFAGLKLVRKVHRSDGCHGYVLSSPGHFHTLICSQCNRSTEFKGDEKLEELIADLELKTGYKIEDHFLQLSGICPQCQ